MQAPSNKRIEIRNRCFVPVESKKDSDFDQTRTVDISPHGIGFISSHPHNIDEKIAIEIQLKPDTDPVLVVGTVKWVHRIPGVEQFRIGMNYDDFISGTPKRLDRYLK